MTQRTGRVVCTRCGANNFDTVSACWKCGVALGASPAFAAAPSPPGVGAGERSAPMAAAAAPTGSSAVAKRAAIALALTIPFIGLPIGWAFMMIEDSRRQAIGRFCVNWSLLGLVLHLFLFYLGMQATMQMAARFLPMVAGAMQKGSPGGSPDSGLPPGFGSEGR